MVSGLRVERQSISAATASMLLLASGAFAQELAPTPPDDNPPIAAVAETDRVVVTGTYIPSLQRNRKALCRSRLS